MNQNLKDTFARLLALTEQGHTLHTVTLIAAPPQASQWLGQMLLVFPDGTVEGTLIDADFTRAAAEQAVALGEHAAGTFALTYNNQTCRCFRDFIKPKQKAVILGGGHISQPLAEILALLDFHVTVADDRPEFANKNRFPRAGAVICDTFANVFGKVRIDANTAVIIVTRGHRHDQDCLRKALDFNPKYLGMIGSRRKVMTLFGELRAEGVDPNRLACVKSPIGLDIGAQTPAEIAVSIAAEIISIFRKSQSPYSLCETEGHPWKKNCSDL